MSKSGNCLVALACDFFPRIVSVGKAGLGVGVVLGLERMGRSRRTVGRSAGRGIPCPAGCRPARRRCRRGRGARSRRRRGDRGRWAGRPGRALHRPTGKLAVAVGPLPPLGFADRHLAEDDLVAAQRPVPHPVVRNPRSAARRKKPDSAAPSILHNIVRGNADAGKRFGSQGRIFLDCAHKLGAAGSLHCGQIASRRLDPERAAASSLATPRTPRAINRDDQLAVEHQAKRPVQMRPGQA